MKDKQKNISIAELRQKSLARAKDLYQKPAAKISLEVIISVLAIVFLAVFAIQPTLSTMSQLVKDIEDREKTAEALNKKVQALSEVSTQLTQLKNDLKLLDSALPSTPDINGFLLRVERLATDHSIILTNLNSSNVPKNLTSPKNQSDVQSLPIQLIAKGPFSNMKSFLNDLQKLDRFVSVENITISTEQKETETKEQQVRATIQGYFFGTPVNPVDEKQEKTKTSSSDEETKL